MVVVPAKRRPPAQEAKIVFVTSGLAWGDTRDCALGSGPATWTCNPTTECPFESGKYGIATATNGSWTGEQSSNNACDNTYRLYCFEQ